MGISSTENEGGEDRSSYTRENKEFKKNGVRASDMPRECSAPSMTPKFVPPKNGFAHHSPKSKSHETTLAGDNDSFYRDQKDGFIQNRDVAKRKMQESFEECSLLDAIYTYLCYTFLILVGYVNDLIRPRAAKEKNRAGYVSLYASFESFYTRHIYRRVRHCWNIPVASVPGKHITLLERTTPDNGWTVELTGKSLECINLGSYNYLGFAENDGLCAKSAVAEVRELGVGTCNPRRELGCTKYLTELDKLTARFMGTEDALTCGMGFATNTLNLPNIMDKGCLVVSDEKNHASIILGLRLSGATVRVFKHNNMKSLEKRLRDGILNGQPRTHLPWKKIFIVVEGVYSMEGSIVRLPEILALKKKYGAYIYLDEAHSVGAIGAHGRGVVDYFSCDPKEVDILMGTFTKSFGSAGGYIAGSKALIDMLRKRSHAHAYGTAMSAPVAKQIYTSMKIIMGELGSGEGARRISQLAKNSRYFRQKLKQEGFIVYGNDDSPVVPVALYYPSRILYVIREMIYKGVATVGVGFPATALVAGRARFCVSAAHTKEMLDKAVEVMVDVGGDVCADNSTLPRSKEEILYEDVDLEKDID
jgi:serine palmitoyltransferase